MQIRSAHLQPLLGGFELGADLFDERPEPRAVVHFCEMRDFVRVFYEYKEAGLIK